MNTARDTARLTTHTLNAALRDLLRCVACGKTYVVANTAGHRQPARLESVSAATHCVCDGGPVTTPAPVSDAAHWEAASDALATHRARSEASEEEELAWVTDLCAGQAFASRDDLEVYVVRAKVALVSRPMRASEVQRLRLTVDRVWRRAALGRAEGRVTVALSTLLTYQVAVNALLLDRHVRADAPMLRPGEAKEMQAALLAGVTPDVFVDRIAARQAAEPCQLGCRKPQHCAGCDQCETTTRERRAHARGVEGGSGSRVRWCDECAATVNADQHDVFDRVA
jgi:hypothetical protein